jgi:hypothetical protein
MRRHGEKCAQFRDSLPNGMQIAFGVFRKVCAAAMIALAVTGCTKTWTKPGATQADFDKDAAYCEMQAQMAGSSSGPNPFNAGMNMQNVRYYCMKSRGWNVQ